MNISSKFYLFLLQAEDIHVNMTLMFSLTQAMVAAEAS